MANTKIAQRKPKQRIAMASTVSELLYMVADALSGESLGPRIKGASSPVLLETLIDGKPQRYTLCDSYVATVAGKRVLVLTTSDDYAV